MVVNGHVLRGCGICFNEIGSTGCRRVESMTDSAELRVDRGARTLKDLALEKMREAILDLHFRPGERLVERNLCERLGVSRSVVREVLRHLEAEGLVETVPSQGPAVARPEPAKAAEIYEIRGLLEAEAAKACAEKGTDRDFARLEKIINQIAQAFKHNNPRDVLRLTNAFYQLLFEVAQKPVAWTVVQSLNARINHLRAMTISTPERGQSAIAEMRTLLQALVKRDGNAAHKASLAHVRRVAELANTVLQGQAAPDVPAGAPTKKRRTA